MLLVTAFLHTTLRNQGKNNLQYNRFCLEALIDKTIKHNVKARYLVTEGDCFLVHRKSNHAK